MNFLDFCKDVLHLEIKKSELMVIERHRTVRVCSLPIGLPFERYFFKTSFSKLKISRTWYYFIVLSLQYSTCPDHLH